MGCCQGKSKKIENAPSQKSISKQGSLRQAARRSSIDHHKTHSIHGDHQHGNKSDKNFNPSGDIPEINNNRIDQSHNLEYDINNVDSPKV